MKPNLLFGRFILLSLLWLAMCREKPEPVRPVDPCLGKKPVTADFTIKENVGDSLVETNQVLMYNFATFEAVGEYDSYEWQIGDDERVFTGKKVSLLFLDHLAGLRIPVRLTVKGQPDRSCFPTGKSVDTLTKSFTVIRYEQAPIVGRYEGYFGSDQNTKEVVEVKYVSPEEVPVSEPFGGFDLTNINRGCNTTGILINNFSVWNSIDRGSRALRFDAYRGASVYVYDCQAPEAWLRLRGNDTLVVNFSTGQLGSTVRNKDHFVGSRIR